MRRCKKDGTQQRRMEVSLSVDGWSWIMSHTHRGIPAAVRGVLAAWCAMDGPLPDEVDDSTPQFRRARYGSAVQWYIWLPEETWRKIRERAGGKGQPEYGAVLRAALAAVARSHRVVRAARGTGGRAGGKS